MVRNKGDWRGLAQEGSEESKDFNSNQNRDHACDSLLKNLAAFSPCPKNLPEAKIKSSGPISMVEEVLGA